MQQADRPTQRVAHAEFPLQNPHGIFAPQRAQPPVGPRKRPGAEPLLERRLPVPRQLGRSARLGLGRDRVDPAVAVGVRPTLHEAAGAADLVSRRLRRQALQRPAHRPVAVPLFGSAFAGDEAIELVTVLGPA